MREAEIKDLSDLKRGDIVRHKARGGAMIVDGNYGGCVIAVRTTLITNPEEWVKMVKE